MGSSGVADASAVASNSTPESLACKSPLPAHEVASRINRMVKGMKIFDVETDTCATIELFLPQPDDFKAIFRRALRALQVGTEQFRMALAVGKQPGILDALKRMFGTGPDAQPAT